MICLKCGFDLTDNQSECPRCGVIIAKARPTPTRPVVAAVQNNPSPAPPVEEVTGLRGNATKLRLFAMGIDNLFASIVGILVATKLIKVPPDDWPAGWLFVSLAYLAYYFVQEGIWGTTLGKRAFGLWVVCLDGTPAGWLEAWWRTLFRILEVNPLLLGPVPGGLAIARSKHRQRLGDLAAGTVVVTRKELARASEQAKTEAAPSRGSGEPTPYENAPGDAPKSGAPPSSSIGEPVISDPQPPSRRTPPTLPESTPFLHMKTGFLIGKKYRLEERLGEGAVGVVYRAVHVGLEKAFAIKLLKTTGPPSSAAALERFRREAVALGRLRHPNIVKVTDFGTDGVEGGLPYIVTEFLEGRPLSEVCRGRGPLPLAQALPLLEQIAAAVDAAHEAGVLHRDLKPGNVFVCSESLESPNVKVLDFGLAKLLAGPDEFSDGTSLVGAESLPGLTTTGSLMGTPLYMAPELLRRGKASRSSDIYSFGVLAYEILGGKPPFQGRLDEVLTGHLKTPPLPLPLPPRVWQSLWATLQKDPARRPNTAGEVVRRFRQGMIEVSKPISIATVEAGYRTREQNPYYQRISLIVAVALLVLFCLTLVKAVRSMRYHGRLTWVKSKSAAENNGTRRPVEAQKPIVTFGFNDIEQACGDLSSLPNYLCLVNQGKGQIAGGLRLVLNENLASFTSRTISRNKIEVRVTRKASRYLPYSLHFGPPKGKALMPGLYTEAKIGTTYPCPEEGGRFRVLQILLTADNEIRRFVADFETYCNGSRGRYDTAIGRIAVGERIELHERGEKPHLPAPQRPAEQSSSTAPMSPGVALGFNDIERACGDLSSLPNYLCLLNEGSEQIAGGARRVLNKDLSFFTSDTTSRDGITGIKNVIAVKGKKQHYSFYFYPPSNKTMIPGLYKMPETDLSNLLPGIGIEFKANRDAYYYANSYSCYREGQFRILQILLTDNKVRRFVADFETSCAIGRIAVGERIEIPRVAE